MAQKYGNDGQNDRKKTPSKWQQPKDAHKSGGQYPNYFVWQTRTGNIPLRVDDTKGNESISMQHRSGSMIQFLPNGGIQTVASKGKTDTTFGQHRSLVTGAQDTTVRGDSSHKTEGSRRTTTNGDDENSVKGKSVTTAKSVSVTAGEHFDIAAQSFTAKTKSTLIQATDGPATVSAVGSATLSSKEGSVGMNASAGAAVMQASKEVAVKGSEVHMIGGSGQIAIKDGKVYINSGQAKQPQAVWTSRPEGSTTTEPSAAPADGSMRA